MRRVIAEAASLLLFLVFPHVQAEGGAKTYAFVGSRYIVTAEMATNHTFVVNFINLSDFVIVIQPSEFIYRSAAGRFYIGQVYELEHKDSRGETQKDARGEIQKYTASILLKGHSFAGLTILGSFHEQDQIEEISIRVGAKRYYLQALDKIQFEQLAAKIKEIDMENPSAADTLQAANILEMGTVKSTDGTSEWDRDWQGLLTPDGSNPPKIIERPDISPTDDARRSRTYGKVKLSGIINKSGGIQDLKVVKGLGRGLDERAIEAVKNSWLFLPATRNGEVMETSIVFEVDFQSALKKQ